MRYIHKIEKVAAKHLRLLQVMPDGLHAFMTAYVPWQVVPIVGLASLEVSDENVDGVRTYASKLTATLKERPLPDAEPMAYRLTQTDGRRWLLGSAERPLPLTTITDTHPDRAAEKCACTLMVTVGRTPFLLNP